MIDKFIVYVYIYFKLNLYFRNNESATRPHTTTANGEYNWTQQQRQDQIQSGQQAKITYISDNPKYKDQSIDLHPPPPPPLRPPPSIAPPALQALFERNLTGCTDRIKEGGKIVAPESSGDQRYPPYPNALKRSATLPAKHNRLGVRSRVTFKVPSTAAQAKVEPDNNIISSCHQVVLKEAKKMTSEDLLQPGHVVKERWKVWGNFPSLFHSFYIFLYLLFRLCERLVVAALEKSTKGKTLSLESK